MRDLDTLGRFVAPEKAGQNPFTDTRDRCERLGYVPSHKRIAAIMAAGLQLQVTRDELWDIVANSEDEVLRDIGASPVVRRHLDMDLADLAQINKEYAYKRSLINDRIQALKREEREKQQDVSRQTNPNNGTENAPVKP